MGNQEQEPALKKRPPVSVLMPVYNGEKFLAAAIESILSQSYRHFELIVIDDGSSDATSVILDDYLRRDQRIIVIKNSRNLGIVKSLNRGISRCRGHYIVRMDSDDLALSGRIEKQVAFMEQHPHIAASGGAVRYIDARGRDYGIIRKSTPNAAGLLWANPLLHPTVIIRKSALSCGYQEKYRYAEDYFLWLYLSRHGGLHATSEVLLAYRISHEATRVKCLKRVLWATLKVKKDAVFRLKIRPRWRDLLRFLGEVCLLLLPGSWILAIYMCLLIASNVNRTYAVIFQPLFAWGIEDNRAETLTLTGMKKNQNVIGKIGTPC